MAFAHTEYERTMKGMDEYVKRGDVMKAYEEEQRRNGSWRFEILIESIPSSDVAPIRHGRWDVDGVYVVCSVCNKLTLSPIVKQLPTFKYCPNCGAKMDGE